MSMFEYVMVLASIIIGLGVTHLLQGLAKIVQHPKRAKVYWVHLVWVGYTFLIAAFWWWWQYRYQQDVHVWTFQLYMFILIYAVIIYLMCAILFPEDLHEYDGFESFFYSRRGWYYGLQVLYLGVDLIDSWLKGAAHFFGLGTEYWVSTLVQMALCAVAIKVSNKRFHAILAVAMTLYQISWALRTFDVVN